MICRPEVNMDAKFTENAIFVKGTGKDFVLYFIKSTLIHTSHNCCVIYVLYLKMIAETKCKFQQGLFYDA